MLRVAATLGRIGDRLVISEPKTDRFRRPVPFNAGVVAMMRKHCANQKAERLRAGNLWRDSGLVFTNEFGGPVDPRNLLRVIEVAAHGRGRRRHRGAHAAAQRSRRLAGVGCAHQGRGRSARALVDRDHRRRVRPQLSALRAVQDPNPSRRNHAKADGNSKTAGSSAGQQ
jgi:hypothetical protein